MVWHQRRGSKYGNIRSKIYNGRAYHSLREAEEAMWLDSLVKEKRLATVKPQHKIFLTVNGQSVTTHIVDFLVLLPDGREKFVEIKGFATSEWGIKKRLTEACYPDIPYLVNPNEKQLLS